MSEREDEDPVSCKKFKSSHLNNEIHKGGDKDEFGEGEAGNYVIGPFVKGLITPVSQRLVKKKGTNDHYLMKILFLDNSDVYDDFFLRRTMFHNEYSVLSLLRNHPGVIQLFDFFQDYVDEGKSKIKRICMVLECLIPHGYHNLELVFLDNYLNEKSFSEIEALYTFYNLLLVLEDLHKKNIVHRDLKFSSIILNRKTLKVKLTDFYQAELLNCSSKAQSNQCRISDVSKSEGVLRKISDVASAGFILSGMLTGSVIMCNQVLSSNNNLVSDGTKELLRKLRYKLEASEALDMVSTLLAVQFTSQNPSLLVENKGSDQVVPECSNFDSKDQQECPPKPKKRSAATETSPEAEGDAKSFKEKVQKTGDENPQRPALTPSSPKPSQQNGLLSRKEIKCAMLRLGVTSVNSINALSFSYCKKNSCLS